MMKLAYFFTIFFTFWRSSYSAKQTQTPSFDELYNKAKEYENFTIEARRYLHQYPERYLVEHKTSQFIIDTLTEMGVNFTTGWAINTIDPSKGKGGTGVVAQIGTGHPPCIGLRADFDGLPLPELVDVPFKSKHENMMHACGHDAHAAMLLGAAKVLKEYEPQMKGTVKLFFQPGEEGGAGGKFMVDEGCISYYPPAERAFGIHVGANLPTGKVVAPMSHNHAAAEDFIITVKGKGGHAGNHHLVTDPLPAGLAITRALYDIYAREMYFQPETAGLISVTYIHSGEGASNVIPDYTVIGGTLRALKTKTLDYLKARVRHVAKETAEAYKCTADVVKTMITAYPALQNDPEMVQFSAKIFEDTFFGGVDTNVTGTMGGEDFAFFSEKVPSAFFRLGTGSGSEIEGHVPTNNSHHNSLFAVDERAFAQGVAMHCHLAFQSFEELGVKNSEENKQAIDEL